VRLTFLQVKQPSVCAASQFNPHFLPDPDPLPNNAKKRKMAKITAAPIVAMMTLQITATNIPETRAAMIPAIIHFSPVM